MKKIIKTGTICAGACISLFLSSAAYSQTHGLFSTSSATLQEMGATSGTLTFGKSVGGNINYNIPFKMGIGTNAPTQALDVEGFIRSRQLSYSGPLNKRLVYADNTGTLQLLPTGSNGQVLTWNSVTGPGWTNGPTASNSWLLGGNTGASLNNIFGINDLGNTQPIRFFTSGTEKMRLTSVGRLGIGTTAPNAQIGVLIPATSVAGSEKILEGAVDDSPGSFFRIQNGTNFDGSFTPIVWGHQEGSPDPAINLPGIHMIGSIASSQDVNSFRPIVDFVARLDDGNTENFVVTRNLFQWRNHTEVKMTMTADGNLGIGTANPESRLEIDSDLANKSGLKFRKLNANSPTTNPNIGNFNCDKVLTVDDDGNVILMSLNNCLTSALVSSDETNSNKAELEKTKNELQQLKNEMQELKTLVQKLSVTTTEGKSHATLEQNVPNPFDQSTKITYQLIKSGIVELKVFDGNGKMVKTIVNAVQEAGEYTVNCCDGINLPSGTYTYTLVTDGVQLQKKALVVQ